VLGPSSASNDGLKLHPVNPTPQASNVTAEVATQERKCEKCDESLV
jgi:hypothetical protein